MKLHTTANLFYGLDTDNNFYSVNPETFESTLIGSISDTANSMTYDWEHDTFYIVNSNLQIRELRKGLVLSVPQSRPQTLFALPPLPMSATADS